MGNCGMSKHDRVCKIARNGNVKSMIKFLDDNNIKIANVYDRRGQKPLLITIYHNKKHGYEITKELIKRGALVNSKTNGIRTELIIAMGEYRFDICLELLNNGACVNSTNKINSTPLLSASSNGFSNMVKELISRGANVNHANNDNKTALHLALDYESVFYAYYDNTDGKCKKATNEYNPSEVVDILLKNGADANHRLKNGNTPLFMKLSKTDIEKLIKYGADINIRNNDGLTAHDYAIKNRLYEYQSENHVLLRSDNDMYGRCSDTYINKTINTQPSLNILYNNGKINDTDILG